MLNPFPIQWLALFAYLILRFFVGSILIYLGLSHYRNRQELKNVLVLSWWSFGLFSTWILIASEIILGVLLVAGAYTQYAALIVILMSIKLLILRHKFDHPTVPQKLFYVLLLGASLSLLITSAGAFAFDLPI